MVPLQKRKSFMFHTDKITQIENKESAQMGKTLKKYLLFMYDINFKL